MAHAFDTGLALPQRTVIRRGAVTLLSGLKRPAGYLAAVIPWGSVVRSYTDEVGVQELVDSMVKTPSIAIALGDGASVRSGIGGFQSSKTIDLLVYVASGHQRNRLDGRTEIDVAATGNDHADPGLDIIMEHVAELLIGQRCGAHASIKQIVPDREEELFTSPALSIWLMTFKVEVKVIINEFRGVTQLLESIRWRLATDPDEVPPPDAKVDEISLDVNTDNLAPP